MNRNHFFYFLALIGVYGIIGKLVGFFLPIYFKEIGFTGLQTGIFFSISSAATVIMSLPMGISTDRWSIARLFMISFLLIALSYIGLITTTSFLVFCVFAFMGSFGGRFLTIVTDSMVLKISRPNEPIDIGLYHFFNCACIGIGMILGGFIIAGQNFRTAFIIAAIANCAMIGLSWFLPRTERVVVRIEEYRKEVLQPQVVWLTVIFSLSSMHWGAESVAYGPFLKQILGLSNIGIGVYTGSCFFSLAAGALVGAIMVSRKGFGLQSLTMIGFAFSGLFHILMCVPYTPFSFACRALHEFGDGILAFTLYRGIAEVFQIRAIGGCASFVSLWTGISSLFGSLLYGYICQAFGPQWPLMISGAISLSLPGLLAVSKQQVVGVALPAQHKESITT